MEIGDKIEVTNPNSIWKGMKGVVDDFETPNNKGADALVMVKLDNDNECFFWFFVEELSVIGGQ